MAARLAVGVSCIVPRARPVVASVSQRGARRLQRNVSAPTSTWSARGVATSSPAACRGSGRVEIVLPPERDEYGRIKKKWWQRRDAGDHKRQIVWAINGLLLLVILPAAISGVTAAKERAARLRCRRRRKEDAEDLAVLALLNHRREARGEPRVTGAQLWGIVDRLEAETDDARNS